tara:strand:+ start:1592 stop:1957 length:366 start_codon:yes stop_codon:yes gene_type:complete
MALQLNYTDETGTTHSQAYVRIVKLEVDSDRCDFHAMIYHNAASRSKSDGTAEKKAVAVIPYHIVGDNFNTYLAESIIKQEDKSVLTQVYAWLKTLVDTPTDPTGNPNMGHDIDWRTATDV